MASPPQIFDRALVARRLAGRQNPSDFVTDLLLADLADRLSTITRDFEPALIMGPLPEALPQTGFSASGPIRFTRLGTLASGTLPVLPRKDYALIVSLLDLQLVEDVPGLLSHLRAHLAPDGLFVAGFPGGRSLTELRQAWLAADAERRGGTPARVAPMIDVRDAGALLQRAGFALPVADIESHTVRYPGPLELMADLKSLGAANPLLARGRGLLPPAALARAAEIYAERFSDPDGRVRATLDCIWLLGWAPHDSQQKPLRPGAATTSLRDILGDKS